MKRFSFLFISLMTVLAACTRNDQYDTVIYKNNFDNESAENIENARITSFNGSKVLGRYEKSGFTLNLNNLPSHDFIVVTFDLYIHDNWKGNTAGPNGPDIWIMDLDDHNVVYTTFANGICNGGDGCPLQSFPSLTFPFSSNKANSNAIRTDLPGACSLKDQQGGTVLYKIARTFNHTAKSLKLGCFGQLEHNNSEDPLCDKSWSVDNMEVKTIEFK